jgi:hypothetical protein
MEAISQLQRQYMLLKFGVGRVQDCIDWAMERLQLNQEGDDLEVVLLAASTEYDDAFPLVAQIVSRYSCFDVLDDQLAAGKYIATLYPDYLSGAETIESLESIFTKLYYALDYPNWLVMLSRNCEYATDIDVFKEPFEHEFAYIAELWASSASRSEFEAKYSRDVSNQHDARYC